MTFPNLESLLVIVELIGGLAGATFALPENNGRRLLESAGGSSTPNQKMQSLRSGRIALYLNQQPKDITKGFVFGSDPRSCDVLLGNTKGTGISANHFSIHIDCLSRDPMITCLSGNDLRVKPIGARTSTVLSKKKWLRLESGTTMSVHITSNLDALLFSPNRGDLQAVYERNLQAYFLQYKNAVPELANVSLYDDEVTPLILDRCAGLEGIEYYSTKRLETGDVDYDGKVFVYHAKCKPTLDMIQRMAGGHEDVEDWLWSDSKGGRPGKLYVVKNFRDKRTDLALPHRFPELCRLSHLNLEDLVDMIIEPSVFMTVKDDFSLTTLHALQQEEEPLSTKEAGFMLGQIFAALEYLHDHRWTHGNLDPRSIQVMSRNHLWIKLTDFALSDYVGLGKPDGYHAIYASQNIVSTNKSPADIWSAGVVALQLLLPNALPSHKTKDHSRWLSRLENIAGERDRKSGTDVTAFVRSVLKRIVAERPQAAKVLEDAFIVRTRGELPVNNRHYNLPTPQGSRHTSLGVSHSPQGSRDTSLEPSDESYDSHDELDVADGPSSSRSQPRSYRNTFTAVNDRATGTVGGIERRREAEIEEDSGEETETGKRREPVTKKPRRGEVDSTHQTDRSRGKKPR